MTMHYRTTVSAGEGFDFVISDGSMDRHGTRINPRGWDLSTFLRNPIALWAHGRDPARGTVPIGRWENLRVEGDEFKGSLVLSDEGKSTFVDELRHLVQQGILRAVSVGMDYIKEGKRGGPWEIERAGLREVSLVAVGSNTNALAMARSLHISESTLRTVFAEHGDQDLRDVSAPGEKAVSTPNKARAIAGHPPLSKDKPMKTLSQRIEDAQTDLTAKKDRLVELTNADSLDNDAIEELNEHIDVGERTLANLKASEAKIGINAQRDILPAPGVNRRPLGFPQREISGLDLLIRSAVVRSCSLWTGEAVEAVAEKRYPGHEATLALSRAAAPLATTGNAGFVAELQQTSYAALVDALRGKSIYPTLRDRGMAMSFDVAGTAYIPSLTAGGANGSFFAEGSPMRVGRITTAATTMTSRKMGVIIPFSREAAKRSTPNLESLVRRAIIDDTAAILDSHLLDAVAGDTVRPAGLLNGVSATAVGYGGGDYEAVIADFKALLAPFITANAADGITVIMNPSQGLSLDLMVGPDGKLGDWFGKLSSRVSIVESTHATAGRLIAIRNSDLAVAMGDAPDFEISNQATIHMEDSSPEAISTAGSPNVVAAPVRSFFQTDSMGVRMVMDVSWKMVRAGMVRWIDGVSW